MVNLMYAILETKSARPVSEVTGSSVPYMLIRLSYRVHNYHFYSKESIRAVSEGCQHIFSCGGDLTRCVSTRLAPKYCIT